MPGEKRPKQEPVQQSIEMEQRRVSSRPKVPSRRINTSRNSSVDSKTVVETPTKISQRVEQQHNEYDRSRIHQEVHKKEEPPAPPEIMMEKVKELIVCGYPTHIPGQRDFVKEGEDFLASLGANNTFF